MNIDDYILLNKALGHKIISSGDINWMIRNDRVALSLPTLEVFYPDLRSFKYLFNHGVRVITFKTDIGIKNSFEYIFKGNNYSLETFESKIRNQIRKSLKSCTFRKPSMDDMLNRAFMINVKTMERQHRYVDFLAENVRWEKYITTLSDRKDVEIVGAYVSDLLVAYSVFIKVLDKYYIFHPFSDLDYSSYCPMNGIIFQFINRIVDKEGHIEITYGLASYSEKPGLDKFKKGMLFSEYPVSRITVIHPFYAKFVNKNILRLLIWINKFRKLTFLDQFEYLVSSKTAFTGYNKSLK